MQNSINTYSNSVVLANSCILGLQKYKTKHIHPPLLTKYLEGHYFSSDEELEIFKNEPEKKVVDELNRAYPDRRTAKQLHDVFVKDTYMAISTVHAKLSSLEGKSFIHKLDKKQEKEFEERRRRGFFPVNIRKAEDTSAKYIIEDVPYSLNHTLRHVLKNEELSYHLAPGYFQYTKDFQNAWNELATDQTIEKKLINEFQTSIVHMLERFFTIVKNYNNYEISRVAPRGVTEENLKNVCSNCGIDHESRNFIRAIILHFLDDFEVSNDFIAFLDKHKIVNDNGIELYRKAHDKFMQDTPKKTSVNAKQTTKPLGFPFFRGEQIKYKKLDDVPQKLLIIIHALDNNKYEKVTKHYANDEKKYISKNPTTFDSKPRRLPNGYYLRTKKDARRMWKFCEDIILSLIHI